MHFRPGCSPNPNDPRGEPAGFAPAHGLDVENIHAAHREVNGNGRLIREHPNVLVSAALDS
jgi:hypothetical protein